MRSRRGPTTRTRPATTTTSTSPASSSSALAPRAHFCDRRVGDFAGPPVEPPGPVPGPATWLHQVHGAEVVTVTAPGEHTGVDADAAVTARPGCALAVRTADCAPVALLGTDAVGIVHAGWRGLVAGVVERAVHALAGLGVPTGAVRAEVGPCIRAGCYEFDGPGLDEVVARYGPTVRTTTMWGTPALDLVAAVRAALTAAGVSAVEVAGGCTACDTTWYSHRARAETGRQASFVWLDL